jgi:hypothetical protein
LEADEPDLLQAAKCALADIEGLVERDVAALTEDDGETPTPLGLTVKELKAAIATTEPEPKYIPATLRGLPVLVVLTNRFDDGVDCRWSVFCRDHREPAGVLTRTLSGDYRYYPLPGLALSLGMTEEFVKFSASEVKFETPAEGGGQ